MMSTFSLSPLCGSKRSRRPECKQGRRCVRCDAAGCARVDVGGCRGFACGCPPVHVRLQSYIAAACAPDAWEPPCGGGRPSSCRLLPLSGGKAPRDRRVAHSRAKTAPDLAPCGVRPFGYWRKVQVMSGNKDKGKKCGRSNKLPFVLMGGHICVDAAQGGLASVLPFLVIQSGFS